eukprot:TRINITY_DN18499_c0_g1_i1.p1 TRINITY_DN18499_c0_g1~~TRINITY_DN18499_c0_g1_i1.p1  ORF type:complete len:435 (-),score=50.67 TRINITY_DN18499_c0_g1_i1:242-1546(-)
MTLDTSLMVNLVLCGLGTGILSLPWTLAGTGIFNGLVWTAAVLWITYFTIMLLVEAGEREQCFTLEDLLERAVGRLYVGGKAEHMQRYWGLACTASIWVSFWLCLVSYLIVIASNLLPTLHASGALDLCGLTGDSGRPVILVLATVAVFPLCFLDQHRLSFSSLLGTVINCFIVCALLLNFLLSEVSSDDDNTAKEQLSCLVSPPLYHGNFAFLSNLMMAIIIQPCVLPMYKEMADEIRSPANFAKALKMACFILFVLFGGFGTIGYLSFGAKVDGDILTNLPSDQWYTVVSQLGIAVVCLAVYPLILYPMVAPLQGTGQRTLGIVVVNVAALVVSFFVHNLGVVNVFNGAFSVFFFVGLFPAAVARGVLAYKVPSEPLLSNRADDELGEKNASYGVLPMTMLTLVSFVAMVLGLIGDGNGADGLKLTCMLWSW